MNHSTCLNDTIVILQYTFFLLPCKNYISMSHVQSDILAGHDHVVRVTYGRSREEREKKSCRLGTGFPFPNATQCNCGYRT